MKKKKNIANKSIEPFKKELWEELTWFIQESNRATADFINTLLALSNPDKIDSKQFKKDVIDRKRLTYNDELEENLAKTEHLRWNAFYVAMGWKPIDIEEMRIKFPDTKTNGFRKNELAKLHICLAAWDKLDIISKTFCSIAQINKDFNFKDNDRDFIKNIPFIIDGAERVKTHKKQ